MSPSALMRTCRAPGCPALVAHGRCPTHARQAERRRGSASSRGYDHRWRQVRERFFQRLIALGIAPVCGARLPGAPMTTDSWCLAEGVLNAAHRHVDHIVRHAGQDDPRFWNPLRSAVSRTEDGDAGRRVWSATDVRQPRGDTGRNSLVRHD